MARAKGDKRDPKVAESVRRKLDALEEEYGEVPLVAEELSAHPDIFLPYSDLTERVFLNPEHLDKKTVEIAAIAAGSALAGEYCLAVHLRQARKYGATKAEIAEAMMIGAFMSMTVSESVALRKLKEMD